MHASLVLCCGVFSVPVSPVYRDEARLVEVQYRASVEEAPCLSPSLFKVLQRRYTVYITNRDINRG